MKKVSRLFTVLLLLCVVAAVDTSPDKLPDSMFKGQGGLGLSF